MRRRAPSRNVLVRSIPGVYRGHSHPYQIFVCTGSYDRGAGRAWILLCFDRRV